MDLCFTGVNIESPLPSEPCNGQYSSTDCSVSPTALTYLGLPINSSQSAINAAIITQLIGKDLLIADLQNQISTLEHFKGRYDLLADLETAHPTANDGDYAYIGNSLNAVALYIWDSNPDFLGWTLV